MTIAYTRKLQCCYNMISKIIQVFEFENIMIRFDVYLHVVPYKYCYECYQDI